MIPRDISSKICVNDEYNLNVSNEGVEGDLPSTSSFDTVKIETYCPHCFTKHKLEYSGFLPKKIGYKCDGCSEIRYIYNQHTDGKTYVSDVAESLVDEMEKVDSSIAGYNYANFRNDSNDIYRKIKKFRKSKLKINIFYFIFLIFFFMFSLPLIASTNIGILSLFILYPLSTTVGYKIIIMMNRRTEEYVKNFNIKDSKLDSIRLKWFQYGIGKATEENLDSDINELCTNKTSNKEHKKIKSQN